MVNSSELPGKVLSSIKWSAFSEIAAKVLPPVTFLLTARLLTPSDFGVAAMSSMVLSFASIIWEAGLSKALIQNQNEEKIGQMANVVFFTNLLLSIMVYFLVFVSSDLISQLFGDPRICDVLKVSGLMIFIGAFSSVQTALFQKEFAFKKLFYCRLIAAIVPGGTSVILAYHGFGYWALVWGSVVSSFLQTVMLWCLSQWRPSLRYDFDTAKELFHFSKWVMASAFLTWFYAWGDLFVIGFFFSTHEVGLYRTGNYLIVTIFSLFTTPLVPVMYSYFSKIQHDLNLVKSTLLYCSKIVISIIFPISVGLYLVRIPISNLIFGVNWNGIALVIGCLAITHGFTWVVGFNNEAYKAIGRPDVESKILFFCLLFYFVAYCLSAQINFEVFLAVRVFLAISSIIVHTYASRKILEITIWNTFMNIRYQILIVFVSGFLGFSLFQPIDNYLSMVSILVFCLFSYLLLILLLDKQLNNLLFKLLRWNFS